MPCSPIPSLALRTAHLIRIVVDTMTPALIGELVNHGAAFSPDRQAWIIDLTETPLKRRIVLNAALYALGRTHNISFNAE